MPPPPPPSSEPPRPPSPPALGIQQNDVVRILLGPDADELAFVEHVGGDTSEENEDDGDDDADDATDDDVAAFNDAWRAASPFAAPETPLISTYDDNTDTSTDADENDTSRMPPPPGAPFSPPAVPAVAVPHQAAPAPAPITPGALEELQQRAMALLPQGVPVGSARVQLVRAPRGAVMATEALRVEDRAFFPGDVVHASLRYRAAGAGAADGTGVSAVVVGVRKRLLVRRMERGGGDEVRGGFGAGRDEVAVAAGVFQPAFEIDAGELRFFSGLREGCFVVKDDWLGCVEHFHEVLEVRFPSGARCSVQADADYLFAADAEWDGPIEDVEGAYFPGQFVRAEGGFWRDAVWIQGSYEHEVVGIVDSVSVHEVGVDWLAKRATNEIEAFESTPPPDSVKLEEVEPLTEFRSIWWRVGDRGFYDGVIPALPGLETTAGAGERQSEGVELGGGEGQGAQRGESGHHMSEGSGEWEEVNEADYLEGLDEGADADDERHMGNGNSASDDDDGEWEEVTDDEARAVLEGEAGVSGDVFATGHPGGGRARQHLGGRSGGGRLSSAHRHVMATGSEGDGGTGRQPARSRSADADKVVEIVNSRTYLDLLWQDGKTTKDVAAVTVLANNHLGAYDFFPGVLICEAVDDLDEPALAGGGSNDAAADSAPSTTAATTDNGDGILGEADGDSAAAPVSPPVPATSGVGKKGGVVVRVNPSDRTASVRWQVGETTEFGEEEEVSVYELAEREFDIRPGDTVLRVPLSGEPTTELDKSRPDFVGEVIGSGIGCGSVGTLRVAWHRGEVENISPERLLVIGGPDGVEDDEEEGEENEETLLGGVDAGGLVFEVAGGQLEIGQVNEAGDGEATVTLADNWAGEGDSDAVWSAPPRNVANAQPSSSPRLGEMLASGFAAAAAAAGIGAVGVIPPGRSPVAPDEAIEQSVVGNLGSSPVVDAEIVGDSIQPVSVEPSVLALSHSNVAESEMDTEVESASLSPESVRPVGSPSAESADCASMRDTGKESDSKSKPVDPHADMDRFAVVDSLERHYFESGGSSERPIVAGFAGVVRKEWTRLAQHLPAGIFVHASEARLDLLRVAVIGPRETPYEDVLFFFDIWLPPDYPTSPPKMQFMSHNRRLSPNLYESGKVCLSLLGTWDGDGVEKWDPRNSNLLRVLLSIQAMVLVDEPYYTEAGYESQTGSHEGASNSRLYNESALLLSLRHCVTSLREGGSPPDFVEFTCKHYAAAAPGMVGRCKRLLLAAEEKEDAGEPSAGGRPCAASAAKGTSAAVEQSYSSVGFIRSLKSVLPKIEAVASDVERRMRKGS